MGYASAKARVYACGSLIIWTLKDLDLSKGIVISPKNIDKGKRIEIDKSVYKPIVQGIVITNHGGRK